MIFSKLRKILRLLASHALTPTVLAAAWPGRALRERRFMNGPPPKTILISFFGRGIGDCLYFSALLPPLRDRFQDAVIELAILQQMEDFFKGNPYVNRLLVCPDYAHNFPQGLFDFLRSALARRREGAVELLVNPLPTLMMMPPLWDFLILKRYAVGIGDSLKRVFYDRPVPIRWDLHFYEAMQNGLAPLGIGAKSKLCFWTPRGDSADRTLTQAGYPQKAVLIAPGGKRNFEAPEDKNWIFEGFSYVRDELLRRGVPVILIGASYDRSSIEKKVHPLLLDLIGKTSLPELFSIVRVRARLVICNNSALLHIANAFDIPSVSYADHQKIIARWGPYPPNPARHRILQDQPARRVTAEEFLEAVLEKLEAEPANTMAD